MIDHDVGPGPLQHCQITGSENLNLVIDLGHQAPCDALLSADDLDKPEKTYPLRLTHCPESGLAQLDYVVQGTEIYPPEYPYRAGVSWPVVEAHQAMAKDLVGRFGPGFCVDIGSNDGTLLKALKALGCHVLGVEPTDVARIAERENGVPTLQAFFTEQQGLAIAKGFGPARIVTMTNVFAHMAGLGTVMRGLCELLGKDGVFVTESHYLLDVLERNQFDTIYHEHIRTYSLKALMALFPQYGLEVFDVERAARYGGNLRAFVGWKGRHPVSAAVGELLAHEERVGLHDPKSWVAFRSRVFKERDRFMEFLHWHRRNGLTIAGNSCPGRCSTLLNFYGVTPDLIPYLGELPNSLKLGKYLPGKHLPIVSNERILKEQPHFLVLFAWHYAGPIIERLRREGVRSRLIAPLPEFRVYDDKMQAAA